MFKIYCHFTIEFIPFELGSWNVLGMIYTPSRCNALENLKHIVLTEKLPYFNEHTVCYQILFQRDFHVALTQLIITATFRP